MRIMGSPGDGWADGWDLWIAMTGFLNVSDRVRACLIDPGRFLSEALSLGEDGRGRGAAKDVRVMDIEYGCGAGWGKGLMSQLWCWESCRLFDE